MRYGRVPQCVSHHLLYIQFGRQYATAERLVQIIVYGVWRDADRHIGGGFISGALRGALVFGGIYFLWAWAKGKPAEQRVDVSVGSPIITPVASPVVFASSGQSGKKLQTPNSITMPASSEQDQPPVSTSSQMDENAIYATVAGELETDQTDKGLWTRLYVEHDGDEKKTKIAYIKQRAEKLIAIEKSRVFHETQRREEEAKARTELMKNISTGAVDRVDAEKSVGGMGPAYLAACKSGKTSDVKRMITDRPMLLAVRDKEGNTGLHIAVSAGHKDIVACLVEHGIYKQARTDAGTTASDMARQFGLKEIAAILG